MTSKKTTRRALFSSVISLILCFAMLIGTTFAWFTDSVTSGVNQIIAGNLDVEVYYGDPTEKNSIEEIGTLFDVELWEPGAVAYENLTVANVGTLALKYQMSINFANENTVVDADGIDTGYKLSDVLKVAVIDTAVTGERDDLLNSIDESKWMPMANFVAEGKLNPEGKSLFEDEEVEVNDTATYGVVIYWPQSVEDNNWNVQNGKTTSDGEALHVDLGIKLYATQVEAESDSFGNDYDEDATYEESKDESTATVPEGATLVSEGLYQDAEDNYLITNATGLANMREMVKDEQYLDDDGTWILYNDIDMTGVDWTPINGFYGTFDGNGKTISNLTVNVTTGAAGFFGAMNLSTDYLVANPTIKNVTFVNAKITGDTNVGVVAGNMNCGSIENVKVSNAVVNGNEYVGGIIGSAYGSWFTVTGCTVTDSTVKADNDNPNGMIGGIGGYITNADVKNNTVTGCTISGPECVGGILGRGGNKEEYTIAVVVGNTVSGNTVTGTETATVGEQIGDKSNVNEKG